MIRIPEPPRQLPTRRARRCFEPVRQPHEPPSASYCRVRAIRASFLHSFFIMKNAAELSRQLRTEKTPDLAHRRGIVALGLVASASMGVIALYQTGLIKHLPEPPLRMFDADRVDGSAEAYERFSMPDAVLGLGSYAATIGLAAMGGRDRARE